jgi:hypothetical protein
VILLLLWLLAAPGRAQDLPRGLHKIEEAENDEFLYQEIRRAKVTVTDQNNTWTGTNTFESTTTFSGEVHGISSSSAKDISSFSQAQTVFGACVAGSTATVTGSKFDVCFDGAMETQGGGGTRGWTFLVDGAFPAGGTTTKGVMVHGDGDQRPLNMSGCFRGLALSQGQHNFCFSPRGDATPACYSSTLCRFSVKAYKE